MSHALIIGAGPAGLMAAEVLARAGHQVTVADAMPSVGRKFLMAGKSGLNLTKAEPPDAFLSAYAGAPGTFLDAVRAFGPDAVQDWAIGLDQTIFTGSTGRVFPTVMKASPLLRAWLARLNKAGVTFRTRWVWSGWNDDQPVFDTPTGREVVAADVVILAMGGASWARLGSDGAWAAHFKDTAPFKPANCGFAVDWTDHMTPFFGRPVKSTALIAGELVSRGEWVITASGIEGGGVYTVAAAVRDGAALTLDLAPDLTLGALTERIGSKRKKLSRSRLVAKAMRFPPEKVALFNEFTQGKNLTTPHAYAQAIKGLTLPHKGPLPINAAISTAGGLRFAALDAQLMLKDRPGVFAAGEMLDWEAPTGGYLLTGCLATGRAAGIGALAWLDR